MSSNREVLFDNKYSVKKSTTPGVFFHNLPYIERMSTVHDKKEKVNVDGFVERKIRHLNDEEMADGWRLVLPNYILRTAEKPDNDNDKQIYNRHWKFHKFNVHLGQVPYHLMFKMKKVYNDDKLVGYYVRNKIYGYRVSLSDVDKEILNLAKVLHYRCPNYNRVKKLVKIIQSNGVKNGWVLLKANKFLGNSRNK
jgi:hypothetical protein